MNSKPEKTAMKVSMLSDFYIPETAIKIQTPIIRLIYRLHCPKNR